MTSKPSADGIELNKYSKPEQLNLKDYIENRNKFPSKNATITYQEKVENYLANNKNYMLNNDNSVSNENNNTTSIENDYTFNNNNTHHNLSEKEKYDNDNEFGLFNLLDIFDNGNIQISNCRFNDLIKLPDDVISLYIYIYILIFL